MNKILIFTMSVLILVISGCASKTPMYEYADYSESYYAVKKDAGDESMKEWKTALEESIEKSNAQAIRIPPGINANLGYIYLKLNNSDKAILFFNAEKTTYPESTVFMNKLIKKAELMKDGEAK